MKDADRGEGAELIDVGLYGGPGGWEVGHGWLGLGRVVGIEWDAAACMTRAAAGLHTIRADVAELAVEPFVGKVRGLIASPPCQAWSTAGKGAGTAEVDRVHTAVEMCRGGWTDAALAGPWVDPRTPLILQPLRWAWALRPVWIALEQVPPCLPVWEHVADVLRGWGYRAQAVVLNAADYGVPQTRQRAILMASRQPFALPVPTHAQRPEPSLFGDAPEPWVTMAQALGWDGEVQTNDSTNNGSGERYRRATDRPAPVIRRRVDQWWLRRPSTAVCGDPRIFKPEYRTGTMRAGTDAVRVSIHQAAVLQGFPSSYPWQGTKGQQHIQVGNAVPPPLAAAILGALTGRAASTEDAHREAA